MLMYEVEYKKKLIKLLGYCCSAVLKCNPCSKAGVTVMLTLTNGPRRLVLAIYITTLLAILYYSTGYTVLQYWLNCTTVMTSLFYSTGYTVLHYRLYSIKVLATLYYSTDFTL